MKLIFKPVNPKTGKNICGKVDFQIKKESGCPDSFG